MKNKLDYDWHQFHKSLQNYFPHILHPINEPPPKKNKFEELNWWQFDKSFTFYENKIGHPDLIQHINWPKGTLYHLDKYLPELEEGEE